MRRKEVDVRELRNLVRLVSVVLLVPWFGWLIEGILGYEISFEVELISFLSFIVLGSFWCGWLCPFGNLSYFIGKMGERLFPTLQIKTFGKMDKALKLIKYLVVGYFTYVIAAGGYDYFFGSHMAIYKDNAITSGFLGAKKYMIIFLPLIFPRFFCKYICPQKAVYNIIHKLIPAAGIKRNVDKCVSCGMCDHKCPMNIEVSKKEDICGVDCISCYECVEICPKNIKALDTRYLGKKVDPKRFAVIAIMVYVAATYLALRIIG